MPHLTTLAQLDRTALESLLDRADAMRDASDQGHGKLDLLAGRTIANAFFEPSTRTRVSFELGARRLGADVVNFDAPNSSTNKGESLIDTVHTLAAMQLDGLVVRHADNGTADMLAQHAPAGVAIINAGDGTHAHPTQGLLDALTIRQRHPDASALTVTICGDIRHSRVAAADIRALQRLDVNDLRLCGPAALLPEADTFPGCAVTDDFDQALADADVIIMLRMQTERMNGTELPDSAEYFRHYGLTRERLAHAKPDCMVMHPGPINRGIEIAADVADGPQSCILEQVRNGVFLRMAVLATAMGH